MIDRYILGLLYGIKHGQRTEARVKSVLLRRSVSGKGVAILGKVSIMSLERSR